MNTKHVLAPKDVQAMEKAAKVRATRIREKREQEQRESDRVQRAMFNALGTTTPDRPVVVGADRRVTVL